jgi:hypothetical protein
VVREIPAAYRLDIIVADGGSTDGTQATARAAGARVIDAGRGYGRACALGAEKAHPVSTVITFMDGDGADRGDLIGEIARPVLDGAYDLVLASRTRGEREPGPMLWHQVLAGRIAGFGIGALYGVQYSDMCAFRAISRDALQRLGMREMTYGWNIEMQMKSARAGLRSEPGQCNQTDLFIFVAPPDEAGELAADRVRDRYAILDNLHGLGGRLSCGRRALLGMATVERCTR